jgi:twitching motility two-component system response regulator PilG
MLQGTTGSDTAPQDLNPIQILEQLAQAEATGCLQVSSGEVDWLFCFDQGDLIYITHSVAPWERLEYQLRRLSNEVPTLTPSICHQVRTNLESHSSESIQLSDYQAIAWLVELQYIDLKYAEFLVKRLSREALIFYLLVYEVAPQKFREFSHKLPIFCSLDLQRFLDRCRERLEEWQNLAPEIMSPYQRPYFFTNTYTQENLSLKQQQQLGRILKGFSFYHLSALLNQDELLLAQRLYPLIKNKTILLREPQPPFDKLPKFSEKFVSDISIDYDEDTQGKLGELSDSKVTIQVWKIVCVDDSDVILDEITRFLDNSNFQVFTVSDPLKSLRQIIQVEPDLILLDLEMPQMGGSELCSLIRKYPKFKTTPIIMVTSRTGIMEKIKAKLVGATDYLTKPFNQADLLKIIFRYLS